jgi:hypothetical protein
VSGRPAGWPLRATAAGFWARWEGANLEKGGVLGCANGREGQVRLGVRQGAGAEPESQEAGAGDTSGDQRSPGHRGTVPDPLSLATSRKPKPGSGERVLRRGPRLGDRRPPLPEIKSLRGISENTSPKAAVKTHWLRTPISPLPAEPCGSAAEGPALPTATAAKSTRIGRGAGESEQTKAGPVLNHRENAVPSGTSNPPDCGPPAAPDRRPTNAVEAQGCCWGRRRRTRQGQPGAQAALRTFSAIERAIPRA